MLINALCDYYDELEKDGKVVPKGYSNQSVHYLICLTPEGKIDALIDWQLSQQITAKNGKIKEQSVPRNILLPMRTEKRGIDSNIIEHRPLYIFGLNLNGDTFSPNDSTNKAQKSNTAFKEANLTFIEGLDTPIINAYRNFILNWIPENETENPNLLEIGKAYKNSYFAFCLSGQPDVLLHEDSKLKERWNTHFSNNASDDEYCSQCAITGTNKPIARIHKTIKGIYGNNTGIAFVCNNISAGCSYGNEQSYNSNISIEVMNKYTFALNTLLADKNHKNLIDDITVVFWATGGEKNQDCSQFINYILFGSNEKEDKEHTEKILMRLLSDAKEGEVTADKISTVENIDDNVDFYIIGLKPNSGRVSLKFIYRRKFGDILSCIALHQSDMQIGNEVKPIPLWRLKNELKSPKIKKENIDASLLSSIFKSIIYGTEYPMYLLSNLVMRIKTDRSINRVRAGAVKACINRKSRAMGQKEELKLALEKNNLNQAYLCGRLFAVLEKIQKSASTTKLNRTIKDAYFSSAASKPALVFPKLLTLSQNHIKKLNEGNVVFYNKLIEEIIGKINGEFPITLTLVDQGKFIIGYYQQDEDFYKKSNDNNQEEN